MLSTVSVGHTFFSLWCVSALLFFLCIACFHAFIFIHLAVASRLCDHSSDSLTSVFNTCVLTHTCTWHPQGMPRDHSSLASMHLAPTGYASSSLPASFTHAHMHHQRQTSILYAIMGTLGLKYILPYQRAFARAFLSCPLIHLTSSSGLQLARFLSLSLSRSAHCLDFASTACSCWVFAACFEATRVSARW